MNPIPVELPAAEMRMAVAASAKTKDEETKKAIDTGDEDKGVIRKERTMLGEIDISACLLPEKPDLKVKLCERKYTNSRAILSEITITECQKKSYCDICCATFIEELVKPAEHKSCRKDCKMA